MFQLFSKYYRFLRKRFLYAHSPNHPPLPLIPPSGSCTIVHGYILIFDVFLFSKYKNHPIYTIVNRVTSHNLYFFFFRSFQIHEDQRLIFEETTLIILLTFDLQNLKHIIRYGIMHTIIHTIHTILSISSSTSISSIRLHSFSQNG